MPEMPEVESLARFLTEKCVGHTIARIDLVAFSALKTYNPPLSALHGLEIESVTRRGKFLDISAQGSAFGLPSGESRLVALARLSPRCATETE